MKKFFFLFIVFVVFFQSNIFSIDRIHLDKTCDESNNCVLHKWYLIDNYKEEYPNLTSPLDGSKAVDKFPIPAQKYFPDTDSMNFTYYTEFEVSKDYLNPEIITGIHFEAVGDVYTFYLNGKNRNFRT